MLKRMHPESRLLLFELDPELASHLQKIYRGEKRISVLNADAAALPQALAERGLPHCDYVISGIPFSLIEPEAKRSLLRSTFDSLAPHDAAAFVIYQVTNELRDRGHCDHFPRAESEYCLVKYPPCSSRSSTRRPTATGRTVTVATNPHRAPWRVTDSGDELHSPSDFSRLLLHAYRNGVFPMAIDGGEIGWFSPDPRALIPLDERFHVPHGLKRTLKKGSFEVRVDTAFTDVMLGCAGRKETWISSVIRDSYVNLHRLGMAHSVETWMENRLVGGLYGVAVGGAFFGESMFHKVTDASKVSTL
jgi:leucyl/phenylalanyl-tRNA--protein transferase